MPARPSPHPQEPPSPAAPRRWRVPAPALLRAFVCGFGTAIAAALIVNHTALADLIVAPLVLEDTAGAVDAIVVPGAGIVGNCVANVNALRRVILATDQWRAGRGRPVLFTGGPPDGLDCPVSMVMAAFASRLGLPADQTRVETTSRSTRANAEMSAPLLHAASVRRLLIVTDRLHMRRAQASFAHYGFTTERASVPVPETHPDNLSMLWAAGREYVALAYYAMRGWLEPAAEARASHQSAPASGAGTVPSTRDRNISLTIQHPDGPIVILGASYAGGWALPAVAGHPVINKGVAGQQSTEMLERFDRDVVAAAPRAVILWGYINDIFRTPRETVDAAKARALANFDTMIGRARTRGIEPIVATELTIRARDSWSETAASWLGWALGKQSYQDWINGQVLDLNERIRLLAGREGLLLLDLHPVMSDGRGHRRRGFAKDDGSHITPAGYAALTDYARPILVKHLGQRTGS